MNGLLLVNKPVGLTSHDVVQAVRRILKTKEVGHSGTLDPIASGLMVLLVGEATKLSSYITEGDKSYQVGFRLGVDTDTLDITGKILSEKAVTVSEEVVDSVALSLVGEYSFPIPIFSAKKIDGKKLYEYARDGECIEIPEKKMHFWDVKKIKNSEYFLHCSKGSFIRSWVKCLGERLDCGAAMSSLVRISSHKFHIDQAINLESLSELKAEDIGKKMLRMDQALPEVKSIRVRGKDETLLKNGQISHSLRSQLVSLFNPNTDKLIQILPEERGKILAIIGLDEGAGFKIKRVFNC